MTSPEPSIPHGGGFLLSPPASSIISSTTASSNNSSSSAHPTALPHPRSSPLRPGGSKEGAFIRYVDQQLLHMQRRFAKRTTPSSALLSDLERDKADAWGDVAGYGSMGEACGDVAALARVVWVSGTPRLQVPYLISLALFVGSLLAGMPPSPRRLFRALATLDRAFASLLQGRDADSGERLPGFVGVGARGGVSATEKVRIRSLVERTRVAVVEAFKRGEFELEEPEPEPERERARAETEMETDHEGELILEGGEYEMPGEEDDSWDMQIARVYDRTIVELGDSLEEPNIGIITETRH